MNAGRALQSITVVLIVAGALAPAAATTYYIDFDGGSDSNVGTSPTAAFKHYPDDPNATGNAAATSVQAGDTFIFKGGVHYRGTIPVRRPGVAGAPITYDGNTAGTFGEGRAIIDGSDPVTGWTRCQSPDEVNGNPNWANIYWAYIPPPANGLFHVNLCEGDVTLPIAQDPNPFEPFYQDRIGSYRQIRSPIPVNIGGRAEYTDPTYFTQPDEFWGDDAYFAIYARQNRVFRLKLLDYIAAEHKVVFETIPADQYPAGQGRFSMFNALSIIDQPGEYYVKLTPEPNGMHKVFVWPLNGTDEMTVSRRRYGFEIRSVSYITIQGFIVQKQSNAWKPACIESTFGSPGHLTIRDNIFRLMRSLNEPGHRNAALTLSNVSHSVIDNNQFFDNSGASGIMFNNVTDSVASNNYLTRCGSTALGFYGAHRSSMIGNHLYDNRGMHANGLTVYSGCTDILVEGNLVEYGNAGLTAQDGTNITIRNNVFDGYNVGSCIAFWALHNMHNVLVEHNTLVNGSYGIYGQDTGGNAPLTVRNNIICGLSGSTPGTFGYNIYTAGSGTLGPGEIRETNVNLIFVDPGARDYRLRVGSPAIDAGTSSSTAATDHDGRKRPAGLGYDIGAFEYPELSADAGDDQVVIDRSGDGIATVTLDGSASTAPHSTISVYLWTHNATNLGAGPTLDVNLPVGAHTVTLTVYDDRGWSNTDTVLIEVLAVLFADAGDDRVVIDEDDNGFALVILDGTGSFDPDGTITEYMWTNSQGGLVGFGSTVYTVLPHGEHTLTLRVTNAKGERATDTVVITVEPPSALIPGDANGDGKVDLDDFVILKTNFGMTSGATWAHGDFNGDGKVDLDDFILLKQNFGQ